MKKRNEKPKVWSRKGRCPCCNVGTGSKHNNACIFKYTPESKYKERQERARHDKLVGCAMSIIEGVIEPLHFPQRGVSGERYFELEGDIIKIIEQYIYNA